MSKLGIKPGHIVAVQEAGGALDPTLRVQIEERTGGPLVHMEARADVVLITASEGCDLAGLLGAWRGLIRPDGGIWLLTPKRGLPGYVGDRGLITAGQAAGLVDNKICSVSDTVGAMRFVIRRADRTAG